MKRTDLHLYPLSRHDSTEGASVALGHNSSSLCPQTLLAKTSPEAHPSRASRFSRFERVPEDLRLEKQNPNDADDAGPVRQHKQHNYRLFSAPRDAEGWPLDQCTLSDQNPDTTITTSQNR